MLTQRLLRIGGNRALSCSFSTKPKPPKEYVITIHAPNPHLVKYQESWSYMKKRLDWRLKVMGEVGCTMKKKLLGEKPQPPPHFEAMERMYKLIGILIGGYLTGGLYYDEKTRYHSRYDRINLGCLAASIATGAFGGSLIAGTTSFLWPVVLPTVAILWPLSKIEFCPHNQQHNSAR